MNDCERFEATIGEYVSGALGESALGPLLAHCRTCANCRGLLELHRDLVTLACRVPEPDDEEFEALSDRVLRRLGSPGDSRSHALGRGRPRGLPASVGSWLAGAVAASLLVFLAGLASGRALLSPASPASGGSVIKRLTAAIDADAASNRELADVADSRFLYSNVSFRRLDEERVALDFDVTTHVALVEPVHSELLREVLVHSLLNPSTTGARLKAVDYAEGNAEPKVREALIFAMRRDDNLAVRLAALGVLAEWLRFPDVEQAVMATLRDDASVQMRLNALEALAAHRADRENIRRVIEERKQPGDEALLVRLAEYEKPI